MAGSGLRGRVRSARFPLAAPSWPTTVERPDPERKVGLDYDHEWSRRYPVRLARAMVMDNLARPAARVLAPATVRGLEHLQHVEKPVIFAANHLSHMDTPLLLTTLPVEFRHRTVVAAASDYFFDRTWKAVLSSFALATIPIERSKVNRKSGRHRSRADRGRLEPGHLPRRRSLARRLDPTVHGRCRLPGPADGTTGGARLPARHPARPAQERRVRGGERRGARAPNRAAAAACAAPRSRCSSARPLSPDEGENTHRFSDRIEAAVATLSREVHSDWWQARRSVSAVAPVEGAETAHRGPAASPWRRAWALDEAPSRERGSEWPD